MANQTAIKCHDSRIVAEKGMIKTPSKKVLTVGNLAVFRCHRSAQSSPSLSSVLDNQDVI